jgi:electron transfer flavoprotein beta subunit
MSQARAAGPVFVCVRQALDWNVSTKDFRIDRDTNEPVVAFARYRIDQFDEIAVEVTLQAIAGSSASDSLVHAVSVGSPAAQDVLKHAIAMGAAQGTLVEHSATSDTSVPGLLAAATLRVCSEPVVLCGRTGSERGSGVTAPVIAEVLGTPFIANVVRMERHAEGWVCQRESATGYERVLVKGPFVASVTNASFNVPRVPSLKDKMRAHRQSIDSVPAAALVGGDQGTACGLAPLHIRRRHVPEVARQCTRLDGEVSAQAMALASYINAELLTVH